MYSVHFSAESDSFQIKKKKVIKKEEIMHVATSGYWENC
jgi:hypothetical protein